MNEGESQKRRVYMDNAAATPLKPEVLEVMMPFLTENFGNASSIHQEGQKTKQALEESRIKVARILEIKPVGVFFTGNGTESNNLAILGRLRYLHKEKGVAYSDMEVVTTKIEHPSVDEVMAELEGLGVKVKYVKVDEKGIISPTELEKLLSSKTVLITFAYVNSEIGTIQPVLRLVRLVRKFERENNISIMVHLDAAQAPLWLPCAFKQLGVDTMALDAGKCYGPKGVGVLAMSKRIGLLPVAFGGGQEDELRPGTENVAGIVGMARALELAQDNYKERAERVGKLRDEMIEMLLGRVTGTVLNGATGEARVANNINISLLDFDTEYAVVYLDMQGIAASTKSACAGAGGGESAVVKELTADAACSRSTIRFSLGEDTTKEDLEYVVDALVKFCERMRG
ncbi:MAG: cysteine desulfurase family protein [Candidatus Paceibacterota bacterium]